MDDRAFVTRLNDITREHRLKLPVLRKDEDASGHFLSDWVKFLELCVKKGLHLSDPRWQQLSVEGDRPHTRFSIETEGAPPADPDFRVGLQLLMGMLGEDEEAEEPDI